MLALTAAVAVFSYLPIWVSGMPLDVLLSSDAEWYVALAARLQDPALLAADRGFSYSSDIKPGAENWLHWLVIGAAQAAGVSLPSASTFLSVATLVAFVLLVYALMRSTLEDDGLAFVVALMNVIPVHALAATTVGFQPLGFLPRDLALTMAVALLAVYFAAVRRGHGIWLIFLACGLLANIYVLVFAHLAGVLWLAELLREPRRWRGHLANAACFVGGSVPVLVSSIRYLGAGTPPDVEIMRMRHPYMMIFPLGPALRTTLRRVTLYALLTPLLYLAVQRVASAAQRRALVPWARVAIAAAAITAFGIVIENTTTLWPYHLSRASVLFILAAEAICAVGIGALAVRLLGPSGRAVGMAAVVGLLLVQSNLPSVYRHAQGLAATRDERGDLLDAAAWLRQNTKSDDVVLVPTDVDRDLALTLRVHALRPVYVSFKDGGVSMFDGARGRDWHGRLRAQQAVLAMADDDALWRLMREADVTYAVLEGPPAAAIVSSPRFTVAHRAGRFVVARVV